MQDEVQVAVVGDGETAASAAVLADAGAVVDVRETDELAADAASGDLGCDCVVVALGEEDPESASALAAALAGSTPVVAVTAENRAGRARAAMRAGATEHAPRPSTDAETPLLVRRVTATVESRRTRARLADQNGRLEALVSNLPGIAYRCRNEAGWPMEFVKGECEALTGYESGAIERDDVLWGEQVVHPGDRERVWESVQTGLRRDGTFELRYRIVTAGGDVRWVWERGRSRSGLDGEVTAIEGFITDVTEQRRTERRLREETKRLERFAAIVSHDLRNPLNVARGRLELAREECDSDHHDGVERSLDRMDDLVENLLTLARQGDDVQDREPVALDRVARACWGHVATEAASLDCAGGTVRADESRLQQLLENLFRNSVEHAGPDVTVRVGTLAERDGFFVADDGTGIPAEDREEAFDPAYSPGDRGCGLGLSIVSEIASAHGWATSLGESASGGVRFEFVAGDAEND